MKGATVKKAVPAKKAAAKMAKATKDVTTNKTGAEVLQRLTGLKKGTPVIVRGSRCEWLKDGMRGIFSRYDKGRPTLAWVKFRLGSGKTATVRGTLIGTGNLIRAGK